MTLLGFVAFLSREKMVDAARLNDDDERGFENRLKVQKYVYLAQYYGLDLGYRSNIHIDGPYSFDLTEACFELDLNDITSAPIPVGLRKREFLTELKNKSYDWLEIATTILSKKKANNETPTLDHLYIMKPDHEPKFIDSVYKDLHRIAIS